MDDYTVKERRVALSDLLSIQTVNEIYEKNKLYHEVNDGIISGIGYDED